MQQGQVDEEYDDVEEVVDLAFNLATELFAQRLSSNEPLDDSIESFQFVERRSGRRVVPNSRYATSEY